MRNNLPTLISTSALTSGAFAFATGNEAEGLGGAYDANDPADKAIVDGLIEAALDAEREKHEADVEGLKNKNKDLTERLRKARAGEGNDTGEVDRLERELEDAQGELRTAQGQLRETTRQLKKAEADRDTANKTLETESAFSRNMLVENGLTAALVEANVAPHFMEAAKALLAKQGVSVKVEGDNRSAVGPNDKPLGEFVKEWAASDAGKHYVAAPANGGGGANGGNASGGGTTKKLADLTEKERSDLATSNPTEWNRLLAESQQQAA